MLMSTCDGGDTDGDDTSCDAAVLVGSGDLLVMVVTQAVTATQVVMTGN